MIYHIHSAKDIDRVMQYVVAFLQAWDWSKPCTIQVQEYKRRRSVAQNSLLWLWITAISEYTGYRKDEVHESLKRMFLGTEIIRGMDGNEYEVSRSSKKLNTKDFTQYLEQIDLWARQEVEISLPHPDDMYREAMGR